MKKIKKITTRVLFTLLILTPVVAFAHYLIFPEETRCILIGYSIFKKEGRLYFNPNSSVIKLSALKSIIRQATTRVDAFWGKETGNPKFIYCNTDEEFTKYGNNRSDPATTHFKLGAYIVVRDEGADLDIISHEMTHAALGESAGFFNWTFKIPVWFNEGLAMQNDYRNFFSEDTLKARSDNYRNLPHIKSIITAAQFYGGSPAQVKLNYLTARHEVKNWYTKDKLDKLLKDLKSGKSFEEAYGK